MVSFIVAVFCYLIGMSSLAAFFWFIQFMIDETRNAFGWIAVVHNALVFLIFPLQHSMLARPGIHAYLKRFLGDRLIRPFYVGTSGIALWIVLCFWRPFGPLLYELKPVFLFDGFFYLALIFIILSTTTLGHSEMFGLKQGLAAWKGEGLAEPRLSMTGLYAYVRHPITTGFLLSLWSHETMTAGRFEFNLLFSAYALIGTVFEERTLVQAWGERYQNYRKRVGAFIPRFRGGSNK